MELTQRQIIRTVILGMTTPFNKADLFYLLESKHGVSNRNLVLKILDELCDSGVVKFTEIKDNVWGFVVKRNLMVKE